MPVYRNINVTAVYITDTWKVLPGEFFYFPPQGSSRMTSLIDAGMVLSQQPINDADSPPWIHVEHAKYVGVQGYATEVSVVHHSAHVTAYLQEKLPQHDIEERPHLTEYTCYFLNQISKKLFRTVILPHLTETAIGLEMGIIYAEDCEPYRPKMNLKLFLMWGNSNYAGIVTCVPWTAPDQLVYGLPTSDEYVKQRVQMVEEHERETRRKLDEFEHTLHCKAGEWGEPYELGRTVTAWKSTTTRTKKRFG